MSTLDNDCFLALTNNICTVDNATVGEEQFYQWIRVHFPTLFYGFELWLRQHSVSSATGGYTAEKTLASVNHSTAAMRSYFRSFIHVDSFTDANGQHSQSDMDLAIDASPSHALSVG